MVRLSFKSVVPEHAIILGPAPYFRFSGPLIRQGPHNDIVGRYQAYFWKIQGNSFSRCDCRTSTFLYFEDSFGATSERFGPFDHFFISDGTAYIGHEPFARYGEETGRWRHCATNASWPVLVIR
jgi:hypothetical protein